MEFRAISLSMDHIYDFGYFGKITNFSFYIVNTKNTHSLSQSKTALT